MPITIGLDISTKTGVYVYGDGAAFGKVITFPKHKGAIRLRMIEAEMHRILRNWKPDLAVLEAYAHHLNLASFITCVECGTVIRRALYRHKIPWVTIGATSLKLWTTGSGKGKKEGMIASVKEKWGFESPSDDIVDAYALAQFGQLGLSEMVKIPGVKIENKV